MRFRPAPRDDKKICLIISYYGREIDYHEEVRDGGKHFVKKSLLDARRKIIIHCYHSEVRELISELQKISPINEYTVKPIASTRTLSPDPPNKIELYVRYYGRPLELEYPYIKQFAADEEVPSWMTLSSGRRARDDRYSDEDRCHRIMVIEDDVMSVIADLQELVCIKSFTERLSGPEYRFSEAKSDIKKALVSYFGYPLCDVAYASQDDEAKTIYSTNPHLLPIITPKRHMEVDVDEGEEYREYYISLSPKKYEKFMGEIEKLVKVLHICQLNIL